MKQTRQLPAGNLHHKRQFCNRCEVAPCSAQSCSRCVSPGPAQLLLHRRRAVPAHGNGQPSRSLFSHAEFCASLKLLRRVADNPIVQKSALIYGLLLALSAATLAGIGEWASGGFDSSTGGYDSSSAAPDSYTSFASPAEYGSNRPAAILPPAVLTPAVSNVSLSAPGIHHPPHRP